jgi:hypothetical protein
MQCHVLTSRGGMSVNVGFIQHSRGQLGHFIRASLTTPVVSALKNYYAQLKLSKSPGLVNTGALLVLLTLGRGGATSTGLQNQVAWCSRSCQHRGALGLINYGVLSVLSSWLGAPGLINTGMPPVLSTLGFSRPCPAGRPIVLVNAVRWAPLSSRGALDL